MRDLGRAKCPSTRRAIPRPFRNLVLVLDYREPGNALIDLRPATLTPKAWRLLLVLAQSPGTVVSYDTLYEEIWGETVVEANQLSFQKNAVLRTLSAVSPKRDDLIQTFPKSGFMLDLSPREVLILPPEARPR